jgi:hypothetical protein
MWYLSVSYNPMLRGGVAETDRASIVTPAPLIARRKPLLFETAFKAGRERMANRMVEAY